MDRRDMTKAALATLESAFDLATAVARYFPEVDAVTSDLEQFSSDVYAQRGAWEETPPTAETRKLSEFLERKMAAA